MTDEEFQQQIAVVRSVVVSYYRELTELERELLAVIGAYEQSLVINPTGIADQRTDIAP